MKVLRTAEVCTVKELIDCFEEFISKDGSENYLRGKEQNGFKVELVEDELVEDELPNGNVVQDIRLTEME